MFLFGNLLWLERPTAGFPRGRGERGPCTGGPGRLGALGARELLGGAHRAPLVHRDGRLGRDAGLARRETRDETRLDGAGFWWGGFQGTPKSILVGYLDNEMPPSFASPFFPSFKKTKQLPDPHVDTISNGGWGGWMGWGGLGLEPRDGIRHFGVRPTKAQKMRKALAGILNFPFWIQKWPSFPCRFRGHQ